MVVFRSEKYMARVGDGFPRVGTTPRPGELLVPRVGRSTWPDMVVLSFPGKSPRAGHVLPGWAPALARAVSRLAPGVFFLKYGNGARPPPWVLQGPRVAPTGTLPARVGGAVLGAGVKIDLRVYDYFFDKINIILRSAKESMLIEVNSLKLVTASAPDPTGWDMDFPGLNRACPGGSRHPPGGNIEIVGHCRL